MASAAIDVSDGLLGDLGHILKQSGVGATVEVSKTVNLIAALASYTGLVESFDTHISSHDWQRWALSGGDDYELIFTAPVAHREAVALAAEQSQTSVTRIGQIDALRGLRLVDAQGQAVPNDFTSFDHFA